MAHVVGREPSAVGPEQLMVSDVTHASEYDSPHWLDNLRKVLHKIFVSWCSKGVRQWLTAVQSDASGGTYMRTKRCRKQQNRDFIRD
jgi:hypothetical protein